MGFSASVCTWKHGKRWAYSVTYDEALEELFEFTVPLHEELSIPGHVEVVVGHMGAVRRIGDSSYNGYHHMGRESLRRLAGMGWGIGNHSWSHGRVEDDLDLEVRQAREKLEDATGQRVTVYCAPGDNSNITPRIVEALQDAGHLCALGVTDDINGLDCDVWCLNRASNIHRGFGPLQPAFDPYHRLAQACSRSGWVIDYCHCPSVQIPHESKDVYIDEHRARLEAVIQTGGTDVWIATVEEILDYLLCRRHVRIEPLEDSSGNSFSVRLEGLPERTSCRDVTLELNVPTSACRCPVVTVDQHRERALLVSPGQIRITLDLTHPVRISVGEDVL